MKLDSAGSGDCELWTCYTCCLSLVYDISPSCLLGGPVIELFDLCPLSLTVVDTEPVPLS